VRTYLHTRVATLRVYLAVAMLCVLPVLPINAQELHDLRLLNDNNQTDQFCIYCHTPLGPSGNLKPPDWNPLHSELLFGTIGITVFSQSQADAIGSISVACLSCHDGVQAADMGMSVSTTGVASMASHINGSHPVSLPYAQGDPYLLGQDAARKLPKRPKRLVPFRRPQRTMINDTPVWWLETGISGRQKDDVQLYTRRLPPTNAPLPYVECASCHDPHGSNAQLLRLPNNGSQLCRACHNL